MIMYKEFLKEKIAYYKLWIIIFATLDASMIAWIYNHAKKLSISNFILIGFVIFFLSCGLLVINAKARIFLNKMEDYKNGN